VSGKPTWGRISAKRRGGHLIGRLIRELPITVPEELYRRAWFSIRSPCRPATRTPTRGAPVEHYGPLQSEEGIGRASEIVAFVRSQMA
jgi:hypothetical protein